jgi:UDP-N-acetylmuramate dehydrogenase
MISNLSTLQQVLIKTFGESRIRAREPLARYCNWKAGGPADVFLIVRTADELVQALRLAQRHQQPATVLGFGANVLVSDRGIRGLVILNRAERIVFHPDCLVEADSGTNLAVLARRAAEQGVGGLEFLIGIPGTVGAAVAGNAGTRERWIETVLERIRVVGTNGEEYELTRSDLAFSYRHSRIKHTGEVVITAWLRGQPDEPPNIERKMDELLRQRKNQPPGPSAGSVFKNPPGDFAGRLIEQCGLKGARTGGAKISQMHANFIVNLGGGTAADIKALIDRAKAEVERQFGVRLEEEIRYLGDWS